MAKTKFTLEAAFAELEEILAQLEEEGVGLTESMELYKKGVRLLEKCNQALDKTEKELKILQEGQDGRIHEETAGGENRGD